MPCVQVYHRPSDRGDLVTMDLTTALADVSTKSRDLEDTTRIYAQVVGTLENVEGITRATHFNGDQEYGPALSALDLDQGEMRVRFCYSCPATQEDYNPTQARGLAKLLIKTFNAVCKK